MTLRDSGNDIAALAILGPRLLDCLKDGLGQAEPVRHYRACRVDVPME
jgi:hypothetical protein